MDQIGVEMLPGTEVLRDHDGIHLTHANNSADGLVLLPTFSSFSHDPLVGVICPPSAVAGMVNGWRLEILVFLEALTDIYMVERE